jgi:hypothetical protein
MRARYGPKVWAGPIVYLIALLGTPLLANERVRASAVLLLIVSALPAVALWGGQTWIPAHLSAATARPAAFLILGSGLAVLLVGGTLVAYPNSVPPLINHWTPAFPAFYVAMALPVGAWTTAGRSELEPRLS